MALFWAQLSPLLPPATRRGPAGPGGPATRPGLANLLLGLSAWLRTPHRPQRVMTAASKPRQAQLCLEWVHASGYFAKWARNRGNCMLALRPHARHALPGGPSRGDISRTPSNGCGASRNRAPCQRTWTLMTY